MRYNEFKQTKTRRVIASTYKQLNEVNMSPSALQNFLQSDMGQRIVAGFEAELIFPRMDFSESNIDNTEIESTSFAEMDMEEAVEFFAPANAGMTSDAIEQEINNAIDRHVKYHKHDVDSDYDTLNGMINDGGTFDQEAEKNVSEIAQYVRENYKDLIDNELDGDDSDDVAIINAIYDNLEEYKKILINHYFENSELYPETEDSIHEYTKYLVTSYLTMGDIAEQSMLELPSRSRYQEVIDLFQDNTNGFGYKINTGNYKGWSFERDGSLPENTGVEIVSPALPLSEIIDIIPKFFDWVKKNGGESAEETGLHMSLSIEGGDNYNKEYPLTNDLDFVKFAIFLGDSYVLDSFKRYGNEYALSAFDIMNKKLEVTTGDMNNAIHTMRQVSDAFNSFGKKLSAIARNIFKMSYGKYVSINPKEKYVEIRSAGNEGYFDDTTKIQNMLLRYAYAFSIAMNPQAETREYAKKLYQYLSGFTFPGKSKVDVVKLFSLYNSGVIDKRELIKYVEQSKRLGVINSAHYQHIKIVVNNQYVAIIEELSGTDLTIMQINSRNTKYSELSNEVRREIQYAISEYIMDDELPMVKNKKTNRMEPFDPMNKNHLPDTDIQITVLSDNLY